MIINLANDKKRISKIQAVICTLILKGIMFLYASKATISFLEKLTVAILKRIHRIKYVGHTNISKH